jgi:hypothetical protein
MKRHRLSTVEPEIPKEEGKESFIGGMAKFYGNVITKAKEKLSGRSKESDMVESP